jgi:DNA-binding transcriptional ArsR family regulator
MAQLYVVFAALGNPIRLAIVERLLNQKRIAAGDLLDVASVFPAAISRHLTVLREAGILVQSKSKQQRIYSIDQETIKAVAAWSSN